MLLNGSELVSFHWHAIEWQRCTHTCDMTRHRVTSPQAPNSASNLTNNICIRTWLYTNGGGKLRSTKPLDNLACHWCMQLRTYIKWITITIAWCVHALEHRRRWNCFVSMGGQDSHTCAHKCVRTYILCQESD